MKRIYFFYFIFSIIISIVILILCISIALNQFKTDFENFETIPKTRNDDLTAKIDFIKETGFTNDTDTQYHDDLDTISKNPQTYSIPSGTKWTKDDLGNTIAVLNDLQGNFLFYDKKSRSKYGSANYVPSYEDSVYLSKYNTTMRSSLYAK